MGLKVLVTGLFEMKLEGGKNMGKEQYKQRHQSQDAYQSLFIQHPNNGIILTDFKDLSIFYTIRL